jgi:4-amino-4-deoxy-L-arabinose transferase-like glycosyltransferase
MRSQGGQTPAQLVFVGRTLLSDSAPLPSSVGQKCPTHTCASPGWLETGYIRSVRELVRQNLRFFGLAVAAALLLRLFFLLFVPKVTTDSLIYADLGKNWLLYGIYARTYDVGVINPTFARLPGYPAFLAFVFAIFGLDNYKPVLAIQLLVDLGTCFVMADLARRCISDRAAKAAFLLTALCPFLAQYSAAALTETLEIFFTALALDYAVIGLDSLDSRSLRPWAWCGVSVAACILLRPDGGVLLLAIGLYLGILLLRAIRAGKPAMPIVRAGLMVAVCALAPLAVWGARNLHTFHRLEFLAPRYANEPDEYVPVGFNRWVNTWIADYTSTEEIYWPIPGDKVDVSNLPSRAFDTPEQRDTTTALFDQYNQDLNIGPELDQRFAALAEERIRSHPLRYYVLLPALKTADMWLRPRTELLPPDSRWYEFGDDKKWIVLAVGLGVMNLSYLLAAVAGLVRGGTIGWVGLPIAYVVLRSLLLATLGNPEARYTLECYPCIILFAAALWFRPHASSSLLDAESR